MQDRRRVPMGAAAAASAIAALSASVTAPAQPGEPVALFDGTLEGWIVENAASDDFAVDGEVLRVSGPQGWLRSRERYDDFVLAVEFRFLSDDADSGVFVRAAGDETFGRGWPNESYQVQLRNPVGRSRFPPVGGLFRHGLPQGETAFDAADAEAASLDTGEWQRLEIELSGSRMSVSLNGTELMRADAIEPGAGYIGLQGEVGTVEIRSIELVPL